MSAATHLPRADRAPVLRGSTIDRAVDLLARPVFWTVVALTGTLAVLSVLRGDAGGAERTGLLGLTALTVVAMIASPRWPGEALVVTALATLGITLLVPTSGVTTGVAGIVIGYGLGRRRSGRALLVPLVIATILFVVCRAVGDWTTGFGSVFAAIAAFYLAPAALGRGMRDRADLRAVLRRRAQADADARDGAVEAALVDERARIAGELHDVVAHALSAMVVQAGGAQAHAERDPGAAEGAFAAVERTGRDALFEIRSLLGVLRDEDERDELELRPGPTLEGLADLVARATRDGVSTALVVEGVPVPLPGGQSLAGYRAVQDALRSAREDGGASEARVRVTYGRSAVGIVVEDDGPRARPTLLVRDRVVLYGGWLRSRSLGSDGGHRLELGLPLERPS